MKKWNAMHYGWMVEGIKGIWCCGSCSSVAKEGRRREIKKGVEERKERYWECIVCFADLIEVTGLNPWVSANRDFLGHILVFSFFLLKGKKFDIKVTSLVNAIIFFFQTMGANIKFLPPYKWCLDFYSIIFFFV